MSENAEESRKKFLVFFVLNEYKYTVDADLSWDYGDDRGYVYNYTF